MRVFVISAALALASAPAVSAQEHVFKLHHFQSAQVPYHTDMLVPWARQVEENSGGQVKIEIHPAMSLGGSPSELIQQARDGTVDIVWTVNGYTPGQFPRTEVFELPGVFEGDPMAANRALHEMYTAGDLGEEYVGTEVMFLHVHPGQAMHMRDAEVRRPEDLEGVNMRVPSRTGAWIIEALGATPVSMPITELKQAMMDRRVDGAFIPWASAPGLGLQELTDYQIEGPDKKRFGTATFQVSMNQERWDSLPDDVKQAFRDASGPDWWVEVGRIWREADDQALEVLTAAGNEHVVLSDEEYAAFEAALEPVVQRWTDEVTAQGIDGEALVQKARRLIEENSGGAM